MNFSNRKERGSLSFSSQRLLGLNADWTSGFQIIGKANLGQDPEDNLIRQAPAAGEQGC